MTPEPQKTEFLACFLETGSESSTLKTVLIDSDDYRAISIGSDGFRLVAGRPQIRKQAWKRWKDLDVYLTGCVCTPRNGSFLDLRRDNLIPSQAAWMKYK